MSIKIYLKVYFLNLINLFPLSTSSHYHAIAYARFT